MDIKLIAFDLDGTFLDDDKNIPPENMRALKYAAAKGVLIVPATGRVFPGIPEELKNRAFFRYYIVSNGSMVYDAVEDAVIRRAELSVEGALAVAEFCADYPVLYDCYKDNWGFMTRSMYELAEEYITSPGILRLVKELRTPVDSLPDYLRALGEPVQKMQVYVREPDLKEQVLRELKVRFPEMAITSSLPFNIELNSRDANKGRALSALCRHLGISEKDVLAFGDGTNDSSLLRTAGIGVAMGNAPDEVKRAADLTTRTNNKAGVADIIFQYI